MKRVILPDPPKADDYQYQNNQLLYNRAVSEWLRASKGLLEQASKINDSPLNQAFMITTSSAFVLTTALSGTSTGTDIANFICSFVQAMIKTGRISQTTPSE